MEEKHRKAKVVKKKGVKAGIASVTLLLSAVIMGCGASAQQGTLKVGVRDDIVGLGYLNPTTDKYYGLEIDIAEELATDMGYQDIEYVTVKPDTRKDMLLEGEVDCLIAAYSISDTRAKNFDFSVPYYADQINVVTQKSSLIDNMQQLEGKTIGVLSGVNTAVQVAIKMNEMGILDDFDRETFEADTYKGNASFKSYESYDELSIGLETGEIDAMAMDGSIAKAYMNDDRMVLEAEFSEQDYGVTTQKDSELSKQVKKSMDKMIQDGIIEKLIDKWN